jgi:heme-degrading monooxygenase HmoA
LWIKWVYYYSVRAKRLFLLRKETATMTKFVEMDENVMLFSQMEEKGGPVILINKFTVKPEEVDQLLKAWGADAEVMKRQAGFISTQLHRGIGGSSVFVNYAVWQSTEHFKQAFNNPEFQSQLANYPPSTTVSPHLFRKVAVPGICVD